MTEARHHARTGIAEATLRAARRMGLSRLFLQIVAQEMPDDALVGLRLEESPTAVVARAAHVCDTTCDLSAHRCLTALKMQSLLGRERRSPFAVAHLEAEGDDIRVHLVPLARTA
ncbi:MAG: hypothetical protein QOG31_1736 [Thermoplasmata archaeon]|jgi:hypothetical protein|nr:hypothetical protein [Thermoplasmata archaeon]